jgi:rubrerythrin
MKPYPMQQSSKIQQLILNIHKSIEDEAVAIQLYTWMLQEARDPLAKDFIEHALNDEKEHLEDFTKLYVHFTGHRPHIQLQPLPTQTYKQALVSALKAELGAQEFYRKIFMGCTDQMVKDVFFNAMMDEVEHAIRFSTLIHLADV